MVDIFSKTEKIVNAPLNIVTITHLILGIIKITYVQILKRVKMILLESNHYTSYFGIIKSPY